MRFSLYLHKAETGGYSGFVPDITGCYFAGQTFDEAVADAESAIDAHLSYQVEQGDDLPVALGVEAHLENEDCNGGYWVFVDVDMTRYSGRAVKLNITLPEYLLARIDVYVKTHKSYGSRSGFLAELAMREINNAG